MYVNCAFTPFPYLNLKVFKYFKFNQKSFIKFLTTDLTPAHESLKNIEL